VSFGAVLALVLVLILLTPVLQRMALERRRVRAIEALEKARGTRVIALIHRQETVGFLGVPLFRFIDIEDSEEVLRAIRMTPDDRPIDVVLHTPGGLALASEQIAYALRDHPGRVTVLVPHYAMSGGTLIALAADEIRLDPAGVLGPVDPQLGDLPAASILRAVAKKPVERLDDRTLILADVAEKAVRHMKETVRSLVEKHVEPKDADALAEELAEDVLARFLRYVVIDTQSDPTSTTYPSTEKQLDLSRLLLEELPPGVQVPVELYDRARVLDAYYIPTHYVARSIARSASAWSKSWSGGIPSRSSP